MKAIKDLTKDKIFEKMTSELVNGGICKRITWKKITMSSEICRRLHEHIYL